MQRWAAVCERGENRFKVMSWEIKSKSKSFESGEVLEVLMISQEIDYVS